MFANSRPVASNQTRPHPRLHALVARHRRRPLQRPPSAAGRECFAEIAAHLGTSPGPLIVDAGCGTGGGSLALARLYPERWIIGIDKSARRLARSGLRDGRPPILRVRDNCLLVQMRLEDFYPLLLAAGWPVQRQYFLYPNPWPKAARLRRRWHAHGLFPLILRAGGVIELRSNWSLYVREFLAALSHYPAYRAEPLAPPPPPPLSPFEKKYAASGHPLYRCVAVPSGCPQPA